MTAPAPILRTRVLALAAPADEAALTQAAAIPGIAMLRSLPGARSLEITYDIGHLTLAEAATRLEAIGIKPARGPLARLRLAWASFQDENRRDQSRIVHQCCNVPPDKR